MLIVEKTVYTESYRLTKNSIMELQPKITSKRIYKRISTVLMQYWSKQTDNNVITGRN